MKRYMAEGINGLRDMPRPGATPKMTASYEEELLGVVRQRPRSLGQDFSMWTLQRLVNYMPNKLEYAYVRNAFAYICKRQILC